VPNRQAVKMYVQLSFFSNQSPETAINLFNVVLNIKATNSATLLMTLLDI